MTKTQLLITVFIWITIPFLGCSKTTKKETLDDASIDSSFDENEDSSIGRSDANSKDSSENPDTGPSISGTGDATGNTYGGAGGTGDGISGSGDYIGNIDGGAGGTGGYTGVSGGASGGSGAPIVDPKAPLFPEEFPQLTCFDQKCPDISRIGSPCCTTGNAPYSLEPDRCGTDVSNFAGLVSVSFDATRCLQLYQPGEIDGFCPDLPAIVPVFTDTQPGCCMESGFCGGWEIMGPLGCHAISNESAEPIPCRLFSTPQECREVFEERGELSSLQECICDYCLDDLLPCRHDLGCIRIWTCMMQSGCRTAGDCYLSENSPCKKEFETYNAISLSYALQVSACVQVNCESR